MKNNLDSLTHHVDPFSNKAKQLSLEFDTATINKDLKTLRELLDNAEKSLDNENDASKAMIYYSLGTAYDDFARFTNNRTEASFQKVISYFRKSIKLIEQDKYTDERYTPYVLGLKKYFILIMLML